jgi:hypothetical protein
LGHKVQCGRVLRVGVEDLLAEHGRAAPVAGLASALGFCKQFGG